MKKTSLALAAAALLVAAGAQAAAQFTGSIVVPGALGDQFGTSVNDGRLGMFSDLYYDRQRNEWWALSDRGPGGGTLNYDTRIQRFTIDVNPTTGAISNFQVQQTVKFTNNGVAYNGIAPSNPAVLGNAFDPEGVVVNPRNGNLLVSDEYGTSVYEFNRSGQFLRALNMPANLVPKVNGVVGYNAPPPPAAGALTSGREGNRGLEGLAISPDGQYAYAMLQNGTVADSSAAGRSMYARIIKFDMDTGNAVAQYAYRMNGAGPAPAQGGGISAIVALDDHRFMVLERNNRGVGAASNLASPDKQVYVIDIAGATDVSNIDLNTLALPSGTVAVTKSASSLLDLGANAPVEFGGRSPEKWEGLTVGPQLADGSFLMLAGTDNDYSVTQIAGTSAQFDVYFNPSLVGTANVSRIQCPMGQTTGCQYIRDNGTDLGASVATLPAGYALIPGLLNGYKISAADLGGYTTPVPEPTTYAMLLAGLGAIGFAARRRRSA